MWAVCLRLGPEPHALGLSEAAPAPMPDSLFGVAVAASSVLLQSEALLTQSQTC